MNSKTLTAFVLAAGLLPAAALAYDPPAIPPLSLPSITAPLLAPNPIIFTTQLPEIAKLDTIAPAPAFTVDWIVPSANSEKVASQFANWRPKTVSDQMMSDADSSPAELASAMAGSGRPPATINDYDPFATTYRDPPAFFRVSFNFGRIHGS